MLAQPDPKACAERLLELALQGGGPDNITVIVADLVNDD
jgi:serine/threonine protein phosphatase PrpC